MRGRDLCGTFLVCSLALAAGQIWAHDVVFPLDPAVLSLPATGPLWRALAALPDLGWLAPLIAAALLAGARRPRRALAVVLAVLLVAFAFEGARHAADLTPHSIQARDRAADSAAAPVLALLIEVSGHAAPDPVLVADLAAWPARRPASAPSLPAPSRAPPSRSA